MKSLNGAHQEVKSNNNKENEMNNLENKVTDVCVVKLSDNLESVSDDFLGVIGVDIKPTIKLVRSYQLKRRNIFEMFEKRKPAMIKGSSYSQKIEYSLKKKFKDAFEKKFEKSNYTHLPFCKDIEYFLEGVASFNEDGYLNLLSARKEYFGKRFTTDNGQNFSAFTTFCIQHYDEMGWMPEIFYAYEQIIYTIDCVNNKNIKLDAEFLRDKEVLKNYLLNAFELEENIPSILEKGFFSNHEKESLKLETLIIQLNRLPVGEDMETRKLSVIK
jgi:hypothetical protein